MTTGEVLRVNTFELIEEQTIDIEMLPDLVLEANQKELNAILQEKINETIRALKHLNKEIQSIKK